MALIQVPSRRIRRDFKPDFAVRLNERGSSITRNLVCKLYLGRYISEMVSGKSASPTLTGTGQASTGIYGREWSTQDVNSSVQVPISQDWSGYQQFTVAFLMRIDAWSTVAYSRLWQKLDTVANGKSQVAVYRQSTSDQLTIIASNAYAIFKTGSISAVVDSKYHKIVITYDYAARLAKMYVDGILYDSQSISNSFLTYSGTGYLDLANGSQYPTTKGSIARFVDFNFAGRVWSAREVAQYSADPFGSLLRPASDAVWVPVAGGGGTTINATIGSFTWGGLSSPLSTQISAGVGGYTWQGKTSPLITTINATIGAYTFAGLSSPLSAQINASVGGYAWGGLSAPLSAQINAAIGTWTWSGKASSIITTPSINAMVGTWTWGGQFSPLARQLNAGVGGWTMQGMAATVTTPSVQLSPQLRFGSDREFTAASDRSFGVGSGANWKAKRYGLIN